MHIAKLVAKKILPKGLLDFIARLRSMKFIFYSGVIRYREDELITSHKCDFLYDNKFKRIYDEAVKDGLAISPTIRWRAHVMCWAASNCIKLDGDFIECGVNKGFLSKIIIDFVNFTNSKKFFYLLDTYEGFSEKYLLPSELQKGIKTGGYEPCYEFVINYFSRYKNIRIIKGIVPETLKLVKSEKIAFISIDMNNAIPEIEAVKFFWDKLVKGGMIILDDYGHAGHEAQKNAFDKLSHDLSFNILALPTGQGLIIKY